VTLPRPDLVRRAYMLGPMAELAPAWLHPVAGRTLAELWRELAPGAPPLADTGIDLNAA
jgi:2-amino-4-hydroxy-6-hydroxymethyldihydropteridine diphosphokinase